MSARISAIALLIVAVGSMTESHAVEEKGALYANSFETPADLPVIQFAESTWAAVMRKAPDAGEAVDGKMSLLLELRFRKPGHCYPLFPLKEEIPLDSLPVYFSGYLKVLDQHPESNHNWGFKMYGEYPKKTSGWKGFELPALHSVALPNGWTYFYSDDIRQLARMNAVNQATPYDGAKVAGYYVRMWNARPGEVVRYRVDHIRFTRFNPVPEPDEASYIRAQELFQLVTQEQAAWRQIADPAAGELSSLLEEAQQALANKEAVADRAVRGLFVGKVKQMERPYWRLKVLQLAVK